MDTFLIFFFIFGVAGVCLLALLRFSKDRYGENSPMKIVRTYQTDPLEYFLRFDHLISYAFGAFVVMFAFLFIKPTITQSIHYSWAVYILIFFSGAICLYIFSYQMIFHFHYWDFTKNITLTTSPSDHSITLDIRGRNLVLRNGDIQKIVYRSNNTKMHFAYYRYHLKNGESFVLTDRTPGLWVIQEYFKRVPVEFSYTLFPFIK